MSDLLPDLTSWSCFACGQDHPKGLRLQFTAPEPDRVRSEFQVSTDHVGLGPIVHGGIVATIFDEAMVWTLYRWRYQPHITARMEQRFRGLIEADTPLIAEAWIASDRGRRRSIEAHIYRADDPEHILAEASGVYLPATASALDVLTDEQRTELTAVFDHFRALDQATGERV
jgi:acyl-coenzyme A thioesterase PaaI-like protein